MVDAVPKIHPLTREIESEDPMELMANPTIGDPDVMLDSLLQEYAWLGWPPGELLNLFRNPMYPVLNQLVEHFGIEAVERRVAELMGENALIRFTEQIDDTVEDDEEHPALVQIGLCDSLRIKQES